MPRNSIVHADNVNQSDRSFRDLYFLSTEMIDLSPSGDGLLNYMYETQ